jgi:hypothetical protein
MARQICRSALARQHPIGHHATSACQSRTEGAMYARVVTANVDPARLDEGYQLLREGAVPMMDSMDGLQSGFVLLASPPTKAMSVLVFTDEEALKASAASHAAMRDRAAQVGIEFVSIEEYEVVGAATPRT